MVRIKTYRNTDLDFLRFIGISCIILAHMNIPGIIFQARNFDVPLMVLLSGISYSQFSLKSYSSYKKYLYSRFVRLIIPTWMFLLFYNSICILGSNAMPSMHYLLLQFALIGGSEIGIWIIRIFFSMALIAPLLLIINNKIDSNAKFYITTLIVYILYEILLHYSKLCFPKNIYQLSKLVVFFTVPYGLIYLFGIRLPSLRAKSIKNIIFIFGTIFVTCLLFLYFNKNKFIPTQQFKYPPQLYYISYAFFISVATFYITKYNQILIDKCILFQFIGRSTLWVYLWHWFFIKLYHYYQLDLNFILKYFLIYSITVIFVYIQTEIIHFIASNNLLQKKHNMLLVKVFTG